MQDKNNEPVLKVALDGGADINHAPQQADLAALDGSHNNAITELKNNLKEHKENNNISRDDQKALKDLFKNYQNKRNILPGNFQMAEVQQIHKQAKEHLKKMLSEMKQREGFIDEAVAQSIENKFAAEMAAAEAKASGYRHNVNPESASAKAGMGLLEGAYYQQTNEKVKWDKANILSAFDGKDHSVIMIQGAPVTRTGNTIKSKSPEALAAVIMANNQPIKLGARGDNPKVVAAVYKILKDQGFDKPIRIDESFKNMKWYNRDNRHPLSTVLQKTNENRAGLIEQARLNPFNQTQDMTPVDRAAKEYTRLVSFGKAGGHNILAKGELVKLIEGLSDEERVQVGKQVFNHYDRLNENLPQGADKEFSANDATAFLDNFVGLIKGQEPRDSFKKDFTREFLEENKSKANPLPTKDCIPKSWKRLKEVNDLVDGKKVQSGEADPDAKPASGPAH